MPLIPQVRFDQLMTNISIMWGPTTHIADDVLAPVPVAMESNVYWVFDKSRFNVPEALRAPRTIYKEIDWAATRDNYFAQEYGLELKIDDRERANAAAGIDLDITSTEILTDNLLNNRERRVANVVMNPANFPAGMTVALAGTALWSDIANSRPMDDVENGRNAIRINSGLLPNRIAFGYTVWSWLKRNTQILTMLDMARPTLELVANLFEVDTILVGSVLTNTAREGQPIALGDVWGKNCLIYYYLDRPALRLPSFGYQMVVQQLRVYRYRVVEINCDVIRVNEIRAEKIVSSLLGYLISPATA